MRSSFIDYNLLDCLENRAHSNGHTWNTNKAKVFLIVFFPFSIFCPKVLLQHVVHPSNPLQRSWPAHLQCMTLGFSVLGKPSALCGTSGVLSGVRDSASKLPAFENAWCTEAPTPVAAEGRASSRGLAPRSMHVSSTAVCPKCILQEYGRDTMSAMPA